MANDQPKERRARPVLAVFLGGVQLALVVSVLVAALALNRILVATGEEETPETAPALAALVEVVRPTPTRERLIVTDTGTVEPRTEVAISPQVGGRVATVSPGFAAGAAFDAGETLFVVDQDDFRLRLRQAQADLRAARGDLALEEAEAASAVREWRLVNPDEPAPPLVAREPQLAQARAAVDVAAAAVDDARLDLKRTAFSLPFAGRVLASTIEEGLTVTANASYGSVYRNDGVEVIVSLTASDVDALAPALGRAADVKGRVGANDRRAEARIVRIDGALDARSRLIDVALAFDGPVPFLPGSFVSVDIAGPEIEDAFVLPPAAVSAAGRVWIVENGRLARLDATIVARDDAAVLTETFDYADGVVTTPPAGAREGQEVRLTDDADALETARAEEG